MSTGRSVRIDEMISNAINDGKKLTADDMIAMQLDTVDVFARRLRPYVVSISESMKSNLSREARMDLELGLSWLRDWDGDMAEDSVAASIH